MTRLLRCVTVAAACVIFCAQSIAAVPAGLKVTVRQGLGGRWWLAACPVTLEVTVDRGHVEGELAWVSDVPRGPARQVVSLRVDAPARQVFRLLEPQPANPLAANAVELDGEPVTRVEALTSPNGLISTRFLAVVLGDAPGYAAAERAAAAEDGQGAQIAIACAAPVEMPESVFGFGPSRLVVLRGAAAARLEPAQVTALLDWVHVGGHLLISPGVPPAPLHDVAWLAALMPAVPGAPRTVSPEEIAHQLGAHVDRPLEAVALTAAAGASPSAGSEGVPLGFRRGAGGGSVEIVGFDEAALAPADLRRFLTMRLAPLEGVQRPLFGQPAEIEVLRAAQAAWAARQDGLIGAGLVAWALVLWVLSRLPAGRTRGPFARLAFRPAVALVAAALLLARRPANPPPQVDVFAALAMEAGGDTASGDAVLAATGSAAGETSVALGPRVRQLAALDRKSGWRAFYAPPSAYRLRAAPAPALEGLRPEGTVPDLVDLAAVVPLGGAWSAKLAARDRQTVDGSITNGTATALETGYLMVDGFACLLPRIEAGATLAGPFRVEHVSMLKPPPGPADAVDALPELLRQVLRAYSFPADGLAALPQLTAAVVGRLAVPPSAYAPRATTAVTWATCWLPIQRREAAPWGPEK